MRKVKSIEERFWPKVHKTDTCWLWIAGKDKNGYGRMHYLTGSDYAHRISFRLHSGEIPSGLTVDHKCHVRNCVNPGHLRLLTLSENASRDARSSLSPTCNQGHDRNDPKNVAFGTRRSGPRAGDTFVMCAECSRVNARRQYQKSRSANIGREEGA